MIDGEHNINPDALESQSQSVIGGLEPDENGGITDTAGVEFDPDLHVVDSNGVPKRNKSGKFRKRPGSVDKKPSRSIATAEQSAEVLINTATGLAASIGGKAWRPSQTENDMLIMSTADYLESKGGIDVPPGLMLSIVVMSYVSASYARMETKPDWKKKLGGLRNAIRRNKKSQKEPEPDTQPKKKADPDPKAN